jgi:hypothetical protein
MFHGTQGKVIFDARKKSTVLFSPIFTKLNFSTALRAGLLYLILPKSNDEDGKYSWRFINIFE